MVDPLTRTIKESALDRLSAELRAGRRQGLTDCLSAMARFHRFRWSNVLLIYAQRPTATRVAGEHAWRRLGRFVKDAEKGILLEPPLERAALAHDWALRKGTRRSATSGPPHVFDVEQTHGRPLPPTAPPRSDVRAYAAKLKEILVSRGCVLVLDGPAEVAISAKGRITLPAGLAPAEFFERLTRQAMHQLLHHEAGRSSLPYVVIEAEARAASFVVRQALTLEQGAPEADVIGIYRGEAKTLAVSLAAIHDASAQILSGLVTEREARTPTSPGPGREPPDPSDSLVYDR